MTRKEWQQVNEDALGIYAGILFHSPVFRSGDREAIRYDLDCPEFQELRELYNLETIAGRGGDFARGKRLLHYLAPRLTHSSWYDNHVECNALRLLAYSLNNPNQGINCLNKSKILQECCLAVGIYARRVSIMPSSPYDFDNHVVTEIYDRSLAKWIMLDPTTDGYFVDEQGTPLSLLEMREKFAADGFVTYVRTTDRLKDLPGLREKYVAENAYICKNLFYFATAQYSTFGEKGKMLWFLPEGISLKTLRIANTRFRIRHMPQDQADWRESMASRLQEMEKLEDAQPSDIASLLSAPI